MHSIKSKLICYLLLLVALPVTFTVIFISARSSSILLEKTREMVFNNLEQVKLNVDSILNCNVGIYSALITDSKLNAILESHADTDGYKEFKNVRGFLDHLTLLTHSYSNLDSVYVYDAEDDLLLSSDGSALINSGYTQTDLFKKVTYENHYGKWLFNERSQGPSWSNHESLISYVYPIRSLHGDISVIGHLVINISCQEIEKYICNMTFGDMKGMFICDKEGNLLACMDQSVFDICKGQGIIKRFIDNLQEQYRIDDVLNESELHVYARYAANQQLYYFVAVPVSKLNAQVHLISNWGIMIGSIVLAVGVYLAALISRNLYKPIAKLTSAMSHVDISGNTEELIEEKRTDEFDILYKSFNQMIINNSTLAKQLIEEQVQKKQMEFRLMQEQINPHFIYNALNSIYYQAKLNDDLKIAEMAMSMSRYFRVILNGGQSHTTLEKITDQLQNYTRIQCIRYDKDFKLIFDIDKDLMSYKVPKILFQPLVENAIEHALRDLDSPAPIEIAGYFADKKHVIFTVTDHGIGIGEEKLQRINDSFISERYEGDDMFALQNVSKRIRLYYGSDATIHLFSQLGMGTIVEMNLPYSEDDEDARV